MNREKRLNLISIIMMSNPTLDYYDPPIQRHDINLFLKLLYLIATRICRNCPESPI